MTTNYIMPTSLQVQQIAQIKVPRLTQDRLGFQLFPLENQDDVIVSWEILDNFRGLQQIRGINGAPQRVKRPGANRFIVEPGVYGDYTELDERELLRRRPLGTLTGGVDVTDLIMQGQDLLLQRRLDRIESIVWTLLSNGTYAVASGIGAILHTDTFPIQSYSAGVSWATAATAKPLYDFRQIAFLAEGYSTAFDTTATAYMNLRTFNFLIANANSADLFGRRAQGLSTIESLSQVNQILTNDNLPNIVIYHEGYYDDTGTWNLFIPTNTVVVIGRRPQNQAVGRYYMTRNAVNPDNAPGPYQIVKKDDNPVPPKIEIHDGHNGALAIFYPSSIVKMSV